MSVDISDGTTTVNLYYADSFSAFVQVSADHGLPMTAIQMVHVDLATLFPDATTSTVFTLTAEVGNGGDALLPSLGYVDGFRLEHDLGSVASYGCGVNPDQSLVVVSGSSALLDTLTVGIDNPAGTQGAGSLTILVTSALPDPGYPCGTLLPNWGMSAPGTPGELLVTVAPNDAQFFFLGPPWAGVGVPSQIPLQIPGALELSGL